MKIKALPDNLKTIKESSFVGCISITSLALPSVLLTISSKAFMDCNFKKITIPSKVQKIETDTFYGCYYLKEATLLPSTPPLMNDTNLGDYADVIYVPSASLENYRTAPVWSQWKDKFRPID